MQKLPFSSHKQKSILRFSTTATTRKEITVITCIYQRAAWNVLSVPWYQTAGDNETPHRLPETVDYYTAHNDDLQYPGQCIHQCLFYTNRAWIKMFKSWYECLQVNREANCLYLIFCTTHIHLKDDYWRLVRHSHCVIRRVNSACLPDCPAACKSGQ